LAARGRFAEASAVVYGRLRSRHSITTPRVVSGPGRNTATGVNCADGTVSPRLPSCFPGADRSHDNFYKIAGPAGIVNKNSSDCTNRASVSGLDPGFAGDQQNVFRTHPKASGLPLTQPLAVDNQTRPFADGCFGVRFGRGTLSGRQDGHDGPDCRRFTISWIKLKQDNPQGYQAEKKAICRGQSAILDRRFFFPGLASTVDSRTSRRPHVRALHCQLAGQLPKAGCQRPHYWTAYSLHTAGT